MYAVQNELKYDDKCIFLEKAELNSYIKAFSDLSDPAVHEQLIKCCQTALRGVDNHQLSDHLTVNDAYNSASNDTSISERSCLQC